MAAIFSLLLYVFRLQKSYNLKCVKITKRIGMSLTDESLQTIIGDIMMEHSNGSQKLPDFGLNEKTQMMVKAKIATVLLEKLKSRMQDNLERSKNIEREFEAAVFNTWRKPLDLLDLLLNICLEISTDFTSEKESKSAKRDYVREALARQQANACLVFNEILHLLKSGFPSGALSHWRTLHEIVCGAYFISENREDVAKRFLDYEAVENWLQAQAIYDYQQNVDCTSLSKKDMKALKKDFEAMEKLYGSDFVKKSNYPYGWIPREVLKTRSFREIENSVKLDTFGAFYDLAGYNLHGGQNGLIFKLGTMKSNNRVVIPVGPTNYGLADPGRSAAISLGQVTACFLMSESDIKGRVIVEALRDLVDQICDAFGKIEAEFAKD